LIDVTASVGSPRAAMLNTASFTLAVRAIGSVDEAPCAPMFVVLRLMAPQPADPAAFCPI